jgi:hypothetical protein
VSRAASRSPGPSSLVWRIARSKRIPSVRRGSSGALRSIASHSAISARARTASRRRPHSAAKVRRHSTKNAWSALGRPHVGGDRLGAGGAGGGEVAERSIDQAGAERDDLGGGGQGQGVVAGHHRLGVAARGQELIGRAGRGGPHAVVGAGRDGGPGQGPGQRDRDRARHCGLDGARGRRASVSVRSRSRRWARARAASSGGPPDCSSWSHSRWASRSLPGVTS